MSSAEQVHTTSRRTLLAGIATAPVIGITGSVAVANTTATSDVLTLVRQWEAAVAAWKLEVQIDEDSPATEAKRQAWEDLEERIFRAPARSADDLRLKMDFYRREISSDDDWLMSIFDDVERLLPMRAVS